MNNELKFVGLISFAQIYPYLVSSVMADEMSRKGKLNSALKFDL